MKKTSIDFLILLVLFALAACSGKERRGEYPYPLYGPPATPNSSSASKSSLPPPNVSQEPIASPEAPKRNYAEPAPVTLVLGGAGVASFATVGLLKKFHDEGVRIEQIIVTGWPAVLALGSAFVGSVHDLEWFAMRLQDKDFNKGGFFELNRSAPDDHVSGLLESTFGAMDISASQQKTPVLISVPTTETREGEVFEHGDWREPLARSMAFPGMFRGFDAGNLNWIDSLQGLNVEEAVRRGARTIVAVSMYDDYLLYLKNLKNSGDEAAFKKRYATQLAKSTHDALRKASIPGRITLKRSPDDFAAKRNAIAAGAKEALRILKELKRLH